ncbi:hypothetical protein BDZ89DRAFT_417025 [Hymenopellis radicata]|nr:hypothetical protein BDZ89DRAFT_417025 [Hymenopellis radicata]
MLPSLVLTSFTSPVSPLNLEVKLMLLPSSSEGARICCDGRSDHLLEEFITHTSRYAGDLAVIFDHADPTPAMVKHPHIQKTAYMGCTVTGRRTQEASAKSNLKTVSLEKP